MVVIIYDNTLCNYKIDISVELEVNNVFDYVYPDTRVSRLERRIVESGKAVSYGLVEVAVL